MAGTSPRQHRVADFIQRELSELIRTQLKDPRISPMLTIAEKGASLSALIDKAVGSNTTSVDDEDERPS